MCVSVCRKLEPPSSDATKAWRRDHIFAFSFMWGGPGVDALLMFGKDSSTQCQAVREYSTSNQPGCVSGAGTRFQCERINSRMEPI
jgi:hypothetical protein